ncbi:MAG: hypothetical protein ACRDY0_09995, partial [Acidimicrobiales bacterium]
MARHIDIELTSAQPDGSWTWRAAGARQPKGTVAGGLLPAGAKSGDLLKADADFEIEGITIVSVVAAKERHREAPATIELIARPAEAAVTTQLAARSGRRPVDRDGPEGRGRGDARPGERRDGRPADRRDGRRPDGVHPGRRDGEGRPDRDGTRLDRRSRPPRDQPGAPGGLGRAVSGPAPSDQSPDPAGPERPGRGPAGPERPGRGPAG